MLISIYLFFSLKAFILELLPMGSFASLPLTFVIFWFVEAPVLLARYFAAVNQAFFDFFSLPLLLKTFFKPLKNEYREGLVGFSIAMGIGIKLVLIFINLFLLIPLLLVELLLLLLFIAFPFLTIFILFL